LYLYQPPIVAQSPMSNQHVEKDYKMNQFYQLQKFISKKQVEAKGQSAEFQTIQPTKRAKDSTDDLL
jgi:hypothetical protein